MRLRKPVLAAVLAAIASLAAPALAQDKPRVGMTYIVEHPAIDAVRDGILAELKAAGYEDGKTIELVTRSAQGNMGTQAQIASDFAGLNLDLAIAISTPSAQAVKNALKNKPVLFAAVTDPVGAGLIDSMARPGGLVTGTSDQQPFPPVLELMKTLVPGLQRLGVIFNPGEANAVSQVEALKTAAKQYGLEIVEAPATQSSMVSDSARSLVGNVQAILLPTDSTVISVIESVVVVGLRAKLPVFASDTDAVERGAVAALGFNYRDMGLATARMAIRILNHTPPSDIPALVPEKQDLYLNTRSAKAMGVELPISLVATARKVVGK
ncbi:ABC transporter substrate-binding protein [Azospirillum sp. TSA6c]|uniref:ABC transporter substrate-binding protein n=1 Tax=unclassified Azospirillum TaxID=2630922 RepID=UPI000D61973F|nr:ABC transporter substrate-binding protein [Azospirillum sp. TSA6c]PWC47024.1 ABC transporter permease [Azospirillum sp. TSA6c]PWC53198.1 ABC transporter permease [Azospirillum sp. TSA6c]